MKMFYVYLLFFTWQICSGWRNEALDLSKTDLSVLSDDNDVNIPWLALLALAKQSRPAKPKRPLSGDTIPRLEARVTDIQHYPWHAQVIAKKKRLTAICGGVVASFRIIITAAHCVVEDDRDDVPPKNVHVLLGSSNLHKGKKYNVCKISDHPGFMEVPFSYYYDVALIYLKTNIKYDKNVQPAKIISNDYWRNTKYSFIVIGYGAALLNRDEDIETSKGPGPLKLRKTRMRFVDSWRCNNSPSSLGQGKMPVPPHMFCMIGERKSDCYGEPGSGVIWGDYIVGIVALSREKKCGTTNIPSMYNDLGFFKDWIRVESSQLKSKCG